MATQNISVFLGFAKLKLPKISERSIQAVLDLHKEGATVPFIARYRKEKTGNLDEVEIRDIINEHEAWTELVARKEFVLTEIAKQGSLTDEIKKQLEASTELHEVEEIYRPYKKKKKTKAKIAMDAGMGPLADWIWGLGHGDVTEGTSLEVKAKEFINPEATFATYEECLRGAQHILVEKLSANIELRALVKQEFFDNGIIESQKTKEFKPNSKFSMYAEFSEAVKILESPKASHRYLAIRRGWQEGELKVSITADENKLLGYFENLAITKPGTQAQEFLKETCKHALTIHVVPSITNELHSLLKDLADKHAIQVFADNVRKVLMGSPFGAKVVLGIDPGIRTGCKVALIDKSGKFVTHTLIHTQTDEHKEQAKKLFSETLSQIHVDAIAVGNGTAGRETEAFVRSILKDIQKDVPVVLINESGASVYSASEVAREEFPDLDITVRGAISIARRLQDPLAELVKIEPKSIGVGQYQHDVNQSLLKKSLEAVVESCVNNVGVDVNTASESLLQNVAGIGPALAKNIVQYRGQKGLFQERGDLLNVPSLSSKAYEQAAGFLRIRGGRVALDSTGVHPERYQAVRDMLSEANVTLSQAMGGQLDSVKNLRTKWKDLIGEFTFDDIVTELAKPGRDPRDPYKLFQFREDIHEMKDLQVAMICPGIVTNVTNFGAFVDIGVHQDGLVHLSQLSHDFVSDPKTVVQPGDQVTVKVLACDLEKKQISLTMKLEERARPEPRPRVQRDGHYEGGRGRQDRGADAGQGRNQNRGPRRPNGDGDNTEARGADRGGPGRSPRGGGRGRGSDRNSDRNPDRNPDRGFDGNPNRNFEQRPRREEEPQFRKIRPVEEPKRYRQDFEEMLDKKYSDRPENQNRPERKFKDTKPDSNSATDAADSVEATQAQKTGMMAARARREAQLKNIKPGGNKPNAPIGARVPITNPNTTASASAEGANTGAPITKPAGDRPPRPASDNRPNQGGGKPFSGGRPQNNDQRKQQQAFNNPFAALKGLKKDGK
jgi:uncharacterized protein